MTTVARNRSVKFEDHKKLVYKLALKYFGRLKSQLPETADFDDVMGELSLAFVKAAQAYDPEHQYTFTAFLSQCLQNHFNKYARRLLLEQFGTDDDTFSVNGLGCISVQSMHSREEELSDDYEILMDESTILPDERLSLRSELKMVMNDSTLLPETRAYIASIANPDLILSETVKTRIRESLPKVRTQIRNRWGVESLTITL